MEAYLSITPLGACLLDSSGEILDFSPFPRNPEEISKRFAALHRGKISEEIEDLLQRWEKSIQILYVESSEVKEAIGSKFSKKIVSAPNLEVFRKFRAEKVAKLSSLAGISEKDYYNLLVDASIELTSSLIKDQLSRKDLLVIKAVDYLDHLNKALNILIPAVREWYGIYFPELNELVDDHETFIRVINLTRKKEELRKEDLISLGISESLADRIVRSSRKSMGSDLGEHDLKILREISSVMLSLYDSRKDVESYIEKLMREIAPNMSDVVHPLVGARLVALAGGLDKLARMPASTIQVLGAHKAIFMHITKGTKPPKHGILFQAKEIRTAPKKVRGKIARLLATKIAIAVKMDAFGRERDLGKRLRAEIDEKISKIREEA